MGGAGLPGQIRAGGARGGGYDTGKGRFWEDMEGKGEVGKCVCLLSVDGRGAEEGVEEGNVEGKEGKEEKVGVL